MIAVVTNPLSVGREKKIDAFVFSLGNGTDADGGWDGREFGKMASLKSRAKTLRTLARNGPPQQILLGRARGFATYYIKVSFNPSPFEFTKGHL